MAFPTAAGQPSMSGSYAPTLYAAKLLIEFYKATVFGAIANTDYEGEIKKFGDTVRIRTLPDITIRDYSNGQDLVYERPEVSYQDLLIDKGKYFGFKVNLLDKVQSDIDFISKWAVHASEQMKSGTNGIDVDVLSNIYGDVHASNAGSTAGAKSGDINLGVSGTPLAMTKVTVLDIIIDCMTVLDEQNAPESGRFLVLPAWACGLIKKSDLKDASLAGDGTSILRNGRIGMIDRAEIFMSNNLSTTSSGGHTASECIFGHKTATTFATQITEKETLKNPNDFGDIIRALAVYGYKVVKPEALGHLHVYKG